MSEDAPAVADHVGDMLGFNIGGFGDPLVSGERSKALQFMLNDRGAEPKLDTDGHAGDKTRDALSQFQYDSGVEKPEHGSGIIGPHTYASLFHPGHSHSTTTTVAEGGVALG